MGMVGNIVGAQGSGGTSLPLGATNDVLLDYTFPTGQAGAYQPNEDDALVMAATSFSGASANLNLDADGYLYQDNGQSYQAAFVLDGLPARNGVRYYQYTGITGSSTPAQWDGISWIFNFTDNDNLWYNYFKWTNTAHMIELAEVASTVWTSRANYTFSTGVNLPVRFQITLADYGDRVTTFANLFETDDGTTDAHYATYTTASRPQQDTTKCILRFEGDVYTDYKIRSARIWDEA